MFDFTLTNKPVVIFIPNFGRKAYIDLLKEQFYTEADPKDYVIVIGNDGIDDNFDNLKDLNVVSFNISRFPEERNGAFIRNYFIKNCQGKYLYQKDPEILVSAHKDPVNCLVEAGKKYPDFVLRPKFTASINQINTSHIFDMGTVRNFIPPLDDVKEIPIDSPERIHYLFGAPVPLLQKMRGYSEDFTSYGPEDRDMFNRLIKSEVVIGQQQGWLATHFYHPVTEKVYENLKDMHLVERSQDQNSIYRNLDRSWGNG